MLNLNDRVDPTMRKFLPFLALASLTGCAAPLPSSNPTMAWVDLSTTTGKLVMAEALDKQRLRDGRFFQVTPGNHELMVRFDFEVPSSGGFNNDPQERLCYVTVNYDRFEAGQRYRLEAIAYQFKASAKLYNAQGKVIAEDRMVNCVP